MFILVLFMVSHFLLVNRHNFIHLRVELAKALLLLVQVLTNQKESFILGIILQSVNHILHLPMAILLDENNSLIPGNLDHLQTLTILAVSCNLQDLTRELNLDQHLVPVNHPELRHFGILVLRFVEFL